MADLKAQLEISADASGVEAGVSRAKKSIATLGGAAKAAGEEASKGFENIGAGAGSSTVKVDAATRSLIASIQRTTAVMEAGSRTSSAYFEILAQQRGVSTDALRPYLQQLDSVISKQQVAQASLRVQQAGMASVGTSARQTAAALRGVPAQITDIVTALQGGQQPLTVLLQQGGQLRDMFGGVTPAARALATTLVGLVNPVTVAAGAAALLAVAYNQGSKEADAFARATILTGNAVGVTVGQFATMARAVDGVVGTQAKAAEVLTQLAGTGKVAAGNLERFTVTAITMERVAGKAVQDTVKEFAELGGAPVEASRKLNERYNYLTLAVFEQIRALEEQGRVAEAGALAQKTYADAMDSRTDQLTQRLGHLERAWTAIKDKAAGAWDAMLNVGRENTLDERLSDLRRQLEGRVQRGPLNDLTGAAFTKGNQALQKEIDLLENQVRVRAEAAARTAQQVNIQKAGIAAEQEIDRIRKASLSNQEKLTAEIKKYRDNIEAIRRANPDSAALDPARIAKDEANIRERFKERVSSKAVQDDAATRMLQQLRETEAVARAQLQSQERLTQAERQQAEFAQLIADLKEKRILTADQKSLLAAREAIQTQLQRNVEVEREVKGRADATKELEKQRQEMERFAERAAQLQQSISSSNAMRREQYEARLSGVGMGAEARERLQAQINIQRDFQRYQEQLDKATPKNLLGGPEYAAQVQQIKSGLADALEAHEEYYKRLAEAQGNWQNGASEAFNNYISDARNIAGQTEQLFTRAFQSMEDSLVEFIQTGKLDFKSLADSIIADITRIIVKQQLARLAESASASGGGEGMWGAIFEGLGSLLSGRATGGPVSAGQMYRVNERRPELLNVGGRQYLMMGNQNGTVQASAPAAAGKTTNVYLTVQAPESGSRQTATQWGAAASEALRRGTRNL